LCVPPCLAQDVALRQQQELQRQFEHIERLELGACACCCCVLRATTPL
jgi:hypothetical protein